MNLWLTWTNCCLVRLTAINEGFTALLGVIEREDLAAVSCTEPASSTSASSSSDRMCAAIVLLASAQLYVRNSK
jgi:hypothetical protein